jgi:hypothetical protein
VQQAEARTADHTHHQTVVGRQLADAARTYHTSTADTGEARKRLYRLVCCGDRCGLPQATMARLAGLTRTRIRQIVAAGRPG